MRAWAAEERRHRVAVWIYDPAKLPPALCIENWQDKADNFAQLQELIWPDE